MTAKGLVKLLLPLHPILRVMFPVFDLTDLLTDPIAIMWPFWVFALGFDPHDPYALQSMRPTIALAIEAMWLTLVSTAVQATAERE